jgi:hypothetical protein
MSITFTPYSAPESDGQFWKWPDACQRDPERFTLNLNNRNAADVLACIGYADETWLEEPLRIEEFTELVQHALRRRLGRRSPALEPHELPRTRGSPLFIDCGREEGYLERRFYDLAMLAARAHEVGATHIGWG